MHIRNATDKVIGTYKPFINKGVKEQNKKTSFKYLLNAGLVFLFAAYRFAQDWIIYITPVIIRVSNLITVPAAVIIKENIST